MTISDPTIAKQETASTAESMLLPSGSDPVRLIVCERSGRWAVGLRRELGDLHLPVQETRSVAECWDVLAGTPASLVVVELTAAVAGDLLGRMARLQRDFPLARVAMVADRSLADYEWLMRESGVVYFTCSPRRLGPLARLASRHLARAPAPPQSVTQRIWASLPWKEMVFRVPACPCMDHPSLTNP